MAWKNRGLCRLLSGFLQVHADSRFTKHTELLVRVTNPLNCGQIRCKCLLFEYPLQVPLFPRPPCIFLSLLWDFCLLLYGKSYSSRGWCSMTRWWTSSIWRRRSSQSFWFPSRESSSPWAWVQGWGITPNKCFVYLLNLDFHWFSI